MTKETPLLHRLMLALTNIGARTFRNTVGTGWQGKTHWSIDRAVLTIENPRLLKAGLCTGSSDLIGWHSVEITPDMVGKRVAVFTAIEGKTGRVPVTEEQVNFLNAVREAGGIAIVVRDDDEIQGAVSTVKTWPFIVGD